MNTLNQLQRSGHSIWLDNIRRKLLTSGELQRHISDLSVTGFTSNPTIFERVIVSRYDYDEAIRNRLNTTKADEALFFESALEDLTAAADLLRPLCEENK